MCHELTVFLWVELKFLRHLVSFLWSNLKASYIIILLKWEKSYFNEIITSQFPTHKKSIITLIKAFKNYLLIFLLFYFFKGENKLCLTILLYIVVCHTFEISRCFSKYCKMFRNIEKVVRMISTFCVWRLRPF